MGRPFLVPVCKRSIVHAKSVHDLSRSQCGVHRNEVGVKITLEVLPGAKVLGVCLQGLFLVIFGPFTGRSAQLEVGKSRSNSLVDISIDRLVNEVVVFERSPESFGMECIAIEGFRCRT